MARRRGQPFLDIEDPEAVGTLWRRGRHTDVRKKTPTTGKAIVRLTLTANNEQISWCLHLKEIPCFLTQVAEKIVQRHEHGQPGAFADLNDEELQQAILESTRELAEIDPDFAKQLAQQKRATKH